MVDGSVYLKPNVLVEPLFNQWYAWSALIAPATAAMYVTNSHLKIMQSFVANPQMHVAALKNPAMRGGPFINYDAGKVPEIKALLEKTLREQSHLVEFAASVKRLSETLAGEALGGSLEPFYERVPDNLRGYVELVYDLNKNPSIRFIEELRRLNGTPAEVLEHRELMALMLPLLRADFESIETYTYTDAEPLDCPITAFGGRRDVSVSPDEMEGWREQTAADFSLHMFEGDHFFLHEHGARLLHIIRRDLGTA